MKVLMSALPVAFASISVTQPQLFDAAHMKETFKGVVTQGGEIDASTKTNIESIIHLIKGNLTAALGVDYNLLVAEYEAAETDLEDCNDKMRRITGDMVHPAEDEFRADLQVHRNCRNFQHATCTWEERNCSNIDSLIKSHGQRWEHWGNQVEDDDCEGENGAVFQWMTAVMEITKEMGPGCPEKPHDVTPAECFNMDIQTGCPLADRTARCVPGSNGTFCRCCDYQTCRANCLTARNLHAAEDALCNTRQETLEETWCNSRSMGCWECEEFLYCFDAKTTSLGTTRAHVETAIDLIVTQQTALECLLCYGEQIISAGTANFEVCEMAPCVGCSGYVYPETNITAIYHDYDTCAAEIFTEKELLLDDNMQSNSSDNGDFFSDDCVRAYSPLLADCTICAEIRGESRVLSVQDVFYGNIELD